MGHAGEAVVEYAAHFPASIACRAAVAAAAAASAAAAADTRVDKQ